MHCITSRIRLLIMLCIKCNQELRVEDFPFKSIARNIRQTACKACLRTYAKAHYRRNVGYYVAKAKRAKPIAQEKLRRIRREVELRCNDCGFAHPSTMEFHHLDPTQKKGVISRIQSADKLRIEMEKCVVLCCNCHRIRHWNEKNASVPKSVAVAVKAAVV